MYGKHITSVDMPDHVLNYYYNDNTLIVTKTYGEHEQKMEIPINNGYIDDAIQHLLIRLDDTVYLCEADWEHFNDRLEGPSMDLPNLKKLFDDKNIFENKKWYDKVTDIFVKWYHHLGVLVGVVFLLVTLVFVICYGGG